MKGVISYTQRQEKIFMKKQKNLLIALLQKNQHIQLIKKNTKRKNKPQQGVEVNTAQNR